MSGFEVEPGIYFHLRLTFFPLLFQNPKTNSITDFMEMLSAEDLNAIEEAEKDCGEPESKKIKAK